MPWPRNPPPSSSLILFHEGPLDRLLSRLGLGGCSPRQAVRRAVFWAAIAWLPTVATAAIGSLASAVPPQIGVLGDFSFFVRCFVALPIIVTAECLTQGELDGVMPTLLSRRLIEAEKTRHLEKIAGLIRVLQRSTSAEVFFLLLSLGLVSERLYLDLPGDLSSWKTTSELPYVFAAGWNQWVGMTLYFFLLLRWLWRYLLWCLFLLRLALLQGPLRFLHPDRVGGLSFLNRRHLMFGMIGTAVASVSSANIAASVLYGRVPIEAFIYPIAFYLLLVESVLVLPLLVFSPALFAFKRRGQTLFGNLAHSYAAQFEDKWLTRAKVTDEALLGTSDIQSLNDLNGAYSHFKRMRYFLFDQRFLILLTGLTVAPFVPLIVLKIPVLEFLKIIVKFLV